MSDLNAFPLFMLGQQNFYGSDLFSAIGLLITGYVVLKKKFLLRKALLPLNILLATTAFALLYGIVNFGFKSIGEGRMIYYFFFLSVPFFLNDRYKFNQQQLIGVIHKTILVAGGAAALMLMIEVLNGGRFFFYGANIEQLAGFEDFRGIRYLDADANFAFNLLAFYFLTMAIYSGKKLSVPHLVGFVVLLIIIILIKNRSALASLMFALMLYFIFQGSLKVLLRTVLTIGLLVFVLVKLLPAGIVQELTVSYQGIINITDDETGSWRMLVQLVAFSQAMQTPWLGQGFGGYYDFYIPELDLSFDYPPHNIFVLLFLKGGIFCVLAAFVSLILITKKYYRLSIKEVDRKVKSLYVLFTILCLSQFFYGMVYAYYVFFFLIAGFMILLVQKTTEQQALSQNAVLDHQANWSEYEN